MAKIAFFNLGLFGHLNPTLAIAERLVRRGHEVTYYVTPEFEAAIRQTGADFRAYDSIFHRGGGPGRPTPLRLLDEIRHALPQVRAALAKDRPELVLYDMMTHSARYAAEECGLPAIRLLPSYAQNEQFRIAWPFASDPVIVADYEREAKALARDLGAPYIAMNDLLALPAALSLVFLPREFQPRGETFDERFVFVGPVLVEHEDRENFPWRFLEGGPLLYASLGTVFNDQPAFFRLVAETFRETPWRVVLALGQRVTPEALGNLPANVYAGSYLPQLALLEKTSLFLTHGGMNSVQGAIWHGVPMVVYPQMREQQESARRVAELKLGLNLEGEALTAGRLREAIAQVAGDETLRANVRRLGQASRAAGGAEAAVLAIERFLAARRGA